MEVSHTTLTKFTDIIVIITCEKCVDIYMYPPPPLCFVKSLTVKVIIHKKTTKELTTLPIPDPKY